MFPPKPKANIKQKMTREEWRKHTGDFLDGKAVIPTPDGGQHVIEREPDKSEQPLEPGEEI